MKTLLRFLCVLGLAVQCLAQAPPILRTRLTTNAVGIIGGTNIVLVNSGTNVQINATSGSAYTLPNYQTGTGYTNVTGDLGSLIICSNAATFTLTIPQAGSAGFPSGWWFRVLNLGAGMVSITPVSCLINGASVQSLNKSDGGLIASDGTNYNFIQVKANQVMQHFGASTQYRVPMAGDTTGRSYIEGPIIGDATKTNANVLGALTADSEWITNSTSAVNFNRHSLTVTTNGNYSVNLASASEFFITLNGNLTLTAPTLPSTSSALCGTNFVVHFIQDATGNRVLTVTTNTANSYWFGSAPSGITLSTNATWEDTAIFTWSNTRLAWRCTGYAPGP